MTPMTYHSKKIAVGLAIITIIAPVLARAETGSQTPEARAERKLAQTTRVDAQACLRLEQRVENLKSKLTENRTLWLARKTERREELGTRKEERLDKLTELRSASDEKREELLSKLEEKFPDAEDQAALKTFSTAIHTAVAKRRAAMDAALLAYRTGAQELLGARQEKMATALATMNTSIGTALEKAKTDCAAGVDKQTIFTTLQASIKAAREKFAADRKSTETNSTDLQELKDTRQAALKKAIETFKTEATAARDAMKTAVEDDDEDENEEDEGEDSSDDADEQ